MLRERVVAFETVVGVERPNLYDIFSFDGQRVLYASERTGGFWQGVSRAAGGHTVNPFVIDVVDNSGRPVLTVAHPSCWFLQRVEVRSGSGRLLGTFEECFSLLKKKLVMKGPDGRERLAMESRVLTPWDFTFSRLPPRTPKRVAHIQKHVEGLAREVFTDADTFRVDFESQSLDADERGLLLAAAIFIDVVWFEHCAG